MLVVDILKEGLANYVQGGYMVSMGVEVGSTKEPPKKKSASVANEDNFSGWWGDSGNGDVEQRCSIGRSYQGRSNAIRGEIQL